MKRFLTLLLITAMFLTLVPGHVHAATSCPGGRHTWGSWTTVKAATCTSGGTETRRCTRCGASETRSTKALGHKWIGDFTQTATCEQEGIKTYVCTRCGVTHAERWPKKDHTPLNVQETVPTCTEPGITRGQMCSVCGTVLSGLEAVPALGHDWDEGELTAEPKGLTPGVRTFTCRRCGDTRTEPVDPTGGVFAGLITGNCKYNLRNNPVDGNVLHITKQPEGGILIGEAPIELTVEAEGGEGEYTYEWFRAPLHPFVSPSQLADLIARQGGLLVDIVTAVQGKTNSGTVEALAEWYKNHGIVAASDSGMTAGMIADAQPLETFNPFAKSLGFTEDGWYGAWDEGVYWCVVRDQAGHHATSDKVSVYEPLRIEKQPQDQNIFGLEYVTLSCFAIGGSGSYTYSWIDNHDTPQGTGASIKIYDIGDYMCLVSDNVTGQQISSWACQVISDEKTQIDLRPVITKQPESVTLEYREDGNYHVNFICEASSATGDDGGLSYQWHWKPFNYGSWFDVAYGGPGTGSVCNFGWGSSDNICGCYEVVVTDERTGKSRTSRMVIVQVKLDCEITKGASFYMSTYLNYAIKGGTGPFRVQVFQRRTRGYLDYPDGHLDVLIEEFVTSERTGTCVEPHKYDYYSSADGEMFPQQTDPQYYLVVYDIVKQHATSNVYGE